VRQNRYAVCRGLNSSSSLSIKGLLSFILIQFPGNSKAQSYLQLEAVLLVVTPCRAVTLAEAALSNNQVEERQVLCHHFWYFPSSKPGKLLENTKQSFC